jgi:membrane fusion protein, multidrug efflux system
MKNIQIIERWHRFLVLFITILWLASCTKKEETKTEKPIFANEEVIPVQLAKVDTVSRAEPIFASGMVASTDEARMSFKVGGIIQKIYVQEGQKVSKGQLLATLNMTEINAQVQQAQYGAEKSERDFRRVQNMFKDTAATLEQLQNVTTGRDVAQQNLTIAKFNQSYAQIRSAISGTIVKKLVNEGELVSPGSPVFMVSSNQKSDWVVRVGVTDKDWARLKVGNNASVTLDAYPDDTFEGKITELAPIADPMNKLYEIEVKINTNGQKLATGMFAKLSLNSAQSRSYAIVPIEAILEGNGKNASVFVLDETKKKVKKIPVTVGYIEGNKILITSGLEGISEVVTSGSAFLGEGASVLVKSVE